MDEALAKSGEWPNVAIPAGSDPAQVMERYGVRPSVFDEPEWEPQRIREKLSNQVVMTIGGNNDRDR